MSQKQNSITSLSTKQIKDLYNIYKQVRAKDLPLLAKTYIDNPKIIVVLMKQKTKTPRITLNDLMKEIKSVKIELKADIAKINTRLDKHEQLFKLHGWINEKY